ncbi:hypothetical protein GBF38_022659 [Nibea albiflora]|uniref:Uncharacterized protein n=1 Tax=Nibea albiflora TaxID=240163 RepID=A0ACB7EWT8_NIBAL|nr:hypothetical protein GBF38_022659 [Nibea albiflora]
MMRKVRILIPLLLLLLPVSCFDPRVDVGIHYSNSREWYSAQAECRRKHIDLVTISDENENMMMIKFHGWIGFHKQDNSLWRWSMGDEKANYTNWEGNDPDSGEHCAYTRGDELVWRSDTCYTAHTYMCYDQRMILVKEKKTWQEALKHCRALEPLDATRPATDDNNNRYDLATLLTGDDYSFAQDKAKENGEGVWTGLRFLAGQWLWMGREPVEHMNITFCPKSQTFCGIMESTGLVLQDCALERSFLCYTTYILTSGGEVIPIV